MSDYSRECGRLIPLCKKGEAEQTVLNLLENEYALAWSEYQEKWSEFTPYEALVDIAYQYYDYQMYFLINDILYENIHYKQSHEVEFCNINKNSDESIDYDTCYWNGGACLTDVLSDAIK